VLADYFELDYWPLLESGSLAGVHLIAGTKSTVFSSDDLARVRTLEGLGRLSLDTIETGHWLHAEDPEGVVKILARRLGAPA
jgi:pimeloyl-ACP methyl ester carboxylesterase